MTMRSLRLSSTAACFFILLSKLCAATPIAGFWCGPGNDVPDLWTEVWQGVGALEELATCTDPAAIENRLDGLDEGMTALHFAAAQRDWSVADPVWTLRQDLSHNKSQIVAAVSRRETAKYNQWMRRLRWQLTTLQESFPSAIFRMSAPGMRVFAGVPTSMAPTVTVEATAPTLRPGLPVEVRLRLHDHNGQPIDCGQLLESHTRKLHALIVDSALRDYHHEHPVAAERRGEYTLTFTPLRSGDYFLWLEIVPSATGVTEMPRVVLSGDRLPSEAPPAVGNLTSAAGALRMHLTLEPEAVRPDCIATARLRVTDQEGRPCFNLQPFMDSFAHAVGFLDDQETIIHTHAQGGVPSEQRRGGPELRFIFAVPKAGQMNLFIQVKVNGKIETAPFSFPVG
jgi:hypothetical protein